jgi:DNA-binding response OmpR family regulator
MKLLIVDDAKSVHAFIKAMLTDPGVKILDAFNGKEAVALIEDCAGGIDLVLLDWEMPIMNGLQTLEEIRSKGFTMPIVMVTSKNDLENISAALEKGANEYVLKPFTKEILLEKMASVTDLRVA